MTNPPLPQKTWWVAALLLAVSILAVVKCGQRPTSSFAFARELMRKQDAVLQKLSAVDDPTVLNIHMVSLE